VQTVEEGVLIAKDLMQQLGIHEEDLISGAYMDLIEAK
jgi:adenylate cyclase class IV